VAVALGLALSLAAAIAFFVLRGGTPSTGGGLQVEWTRVRNAPSFGGAGPQVMTRVRTLASGVIAVGSSGSGGDLDPMTWKSSGNTWTPTQLQEGAGDQQMNGITRWSEGLIAVGTDSSGIDQDAAVWSSEDGTSWQRVRASGLGGPGDQSMQRVVSVAGGAELIAVGVDSRSGDLDGAVWQSSDGLVWKRHELGGPGDQVLNAVVPALSDVVAVGHGTRQGESDAAVWFLTKGKWKRKSIHALRAPGNQEMTSVTPFGTGVIGVGFDDSGGDLDAAVWTSADARNWKRAPDDPGTFGGPGDQAMLGAGYVEDTVIAVGYDDSGGDRDVVVWTSLDGQHWVRQAPQAALGGVGDQEASAFLPARTLYIVGSERIGDDLNAAVWIGHVSR
jgi:hypothetical protein